jgi:nitrite reductase/ring-hydroxylating ferredoxin subunit
MKLPCQKIEDVDNPVVGKFYLVPCLWFSLGFSDRNKWVPIIGPLHEDKDLGIENNHYHHDVRFTPESLWEEYGGIKMMGRVMSEPPVKPMLIKVRRLRMKRQMPDFPKEDYAYADGEVRVAPGTKNKVVAKLEKQFKDVRLTCRVCPHRGMSLKGLPVKDGMVVCNGHGLRWNVETGAMVVR